MQAVDPAPRAGCVVVRNERGVREYLLIGSQSREPHWVFPKGHIEAGETAEMTARREVAEEAGVLVSLLAPLGTHTMPSAHGPVSVTFFLARFLAATAHHEPRAQRWLPFSVARETLSFEEARPVLEAAEAAAASMA
jgi:8-oxo-dGTP pyrophosphatase MutT (NUDIX family)